MWSPACCTSLTVEGKGKDTKDKKYNSLPLLNDERFGWIGGIGKRVKNTIKMRGNKGKRNAFVKEKFPLRG